MEQKMGVLVKLRSGEVDFYSQATVFYEIKDKYKVYDDDQQILAMYSDSSVIEIKYAAQAE
jgi:hypothetical protein